MLDRKLPAMLLFEPTSDIVRSRHVPVFGDSPTLPESLRLAVSMIELPLHESESCAIFPVELCRRAASPLRLCPIIEWQCRQRTPTPSFSSILQDSFRGACGVVVAAVGLNELKTLLTLVSFNEPFR